jgi:hypothetical protein
LPNKQVSDDPSLFPDDSLKDISFMTFAGGDGNKYDLDLMKFMANHFRGIQKFAGRMKETLKGRKDLD